MTSFSELFADAQARRESGDLAGALALFDGREQDLPLQKGLVYLVRAELFAQLGQPDRAIDTLDAALASGCRYKRSWLEENKRLAPLRGSSLFRDLTERSARRYEEDSAAARPELTVVMPRNAALTRRISSSTTRRSPALPPRQTVEDFLVPEWNWAA